MALEILYHDTDTRGARRRETLSGRVVAECAFNFNPKLNHGHQSKLSSEFLDRRKFLLEPRG